MQISLSKIYKIIDEERGRLLKFRRNLLAEAEQSGITDEDVTEDYVAKKKLKLLNRLKKEFALVSDADQLPLGL